MRRGFLFLGLGFVLLNPLTAGAIRAAFSAEEYLRCNPIIVEGVLISDAPVPWEDELEGNP